MIVNNAVYVDGRRAVDPGTLDQTYDLYRRHVGMAWIGLYRPEPEEIRSMAQVFGLHALAVEDAVSAHQRPKLERYGSTLFAVLRPARYLDEVERVEFGEIHVFTGPDIVITIRHAERPDLAQVRDRLEAKPELLRLGPEAVLYAVFDEVVDGYAPVVAGLENDIDQIEDQLFNGDHAVARRIYELTREVIGFQRATHPLVQMLHALQDGFDQYEVDIELRRNLRDVRDHVERVVERADAFRALLQNLLSVQTSLVAQQQNDETRSLAVSSIDQNEEVKKISAWAAILFAPTLVGTIYGMNFHEIPELRWRFGYPFALGLMLATSLTLYAVFRHRDWL